MRGIIRDLRVDFYAAPTRCGAVQVLTAEIEEMLLPLGGRPHWGKIIHARAAALAALYPKLPAFRDLVRSCDPDGKFGNEFLDTHVLG